MKGTITLVNHIKIDGKNVNKLDYDTNEITPELFAEAEAKKQKAGRANGNRSGAMELDYPLHLYLGIAAIVAVNPEYSFEDIERIKGADIIDISVIGRNFTMKSEKSLGADSDGQSETLHASTTQA
ncbi:MAG: hypothetical protein MRZ45_09200 [Blautia sp.]|nr:hypothetical protein [Blautia sp.]